MPRLGRALRQPVIYVRGSEVSGSIIGTGAVTALNAWVAGEGAYTEGPPIGTGAVTAANATTGTFVDPELVTGSETIEGTGAVAALNAAVEGSGTEAITGTGAVTAVNASVAGVGGLQISGTGAVTAPNGAVAGTGSETISGTGAVATTKASMSAFGAVFLMVHLTATYRARASGTAARGKVSFRLTDEIDGVAARVRHRLNLSEGTFTVSLPVKTGGVDYRVVEEIVGSETRPYTITLLDTPLDQDLADLN